MQAADQVGPKILFDLSQVETGFPVRYLHYGLESKARVRHPGIHLPKSDSGKYTIQARVSEAHPGNMEYPCNALRVHFACPSQAGCCSCRAEPPQVIPPNEREERDRLNSQTYCGNRYAGSVLCGLAAYRILPVLC